MLSDPFGNDAVDFDTDLFMSRCASHHASVSKSVASMPKGPDITIAVGWWIEMFHLRPVIKTQVAVRLMLRMPLCAG